MTITYIAEPDEALRECVYRALRTHNRLASPEFWAIRDDPRHASTPVNLFAFNPEGEAVGGLFGFTELSWLRIEIMATQAEYRRQGIGTALLAEAERIGVERGCLYAYADTMAYQAPRFYEAAGYALAGMLHDWDSHGHAKHFYTKRLR